MSDSEPPIKKTKVSNENEPTPPPDIPFNENRAKHLLGSISGTCTGVAYYMHRDQRVQDNWAMIYAQNLALQHSVPLHVVCMITAQHPNDPGATLRNLQFCFEGLREVAAECGKLNIAFHFLVDQSSAEGGGESVARWMTSCDVNCLVTDFSPLRQHRKIVQQIISSKKLPGECAVYQVDAHNVVPVEIASDKQEYGARTIRKKITSKLSEYLTDFPAVTKHPHGDAAAVTRHFADEKGTDVKEDWDSVLKSLKMDETVKPVEQYRGGATAGWAMLEEFVGERIKLYNDKRNDPTVNALSNLSPWFHMGNLSAQRAVKYVKQHASSLSASFVEEAVVRKELADNFCFYNEKYDSIEGASAWAQKTLDDHKDDEREYTYTRDEFETAKTHDELWNAAQRQLMAEGKMHGFMRMYWAKKILEWTESPEKALEEALYFNDHYSLDGNDANGNVGCMWSICGVHDQGWAERPIFGKIRFMNFNGCSRKFDVDAYVRQHGSQNDIKNYFKSSDK